MQRGFTLIIILVGIVIVGAAAGGVYYCQKQQTIKNINSFEQCSKAGYAVMESYPARCATPDGRSFTQQISDEEKKKLQPPANETTSWKTYTNQKYGFQLIYPARGMVINENGSREGECGNAIKEGSDSQAQLFKSYVLVDNFFYIKVADWQRSISDYIKEQGAENLYITEQITSANADEAILLKSLKPGVRYTGYPPLAYISHIYKKGNKLFVISGLQNNGNFGGCDSEKSASAAEFINWSEPWDIARSFKFLENNPSPSSSSKNQCGDGVCQEVTCMAIGCPKPETPQSCPQDCK